MTKTKSIALVIVAVLLGLVAFISLHNPNEPSYQNKGISDWLAQLNSRVRHYDLQKYQDAKKAIEGIGVEAAPYIMAELKQSGSVWHRNYRSLFAEFPRWLQKLTPAPRDEFDFRLGASAFLTIGPPVKPLLINGLEDDHAVVRSASAMALGSLAHYRETDIKDALPALIGGLKDVDIDVRMASVRALGYLGPDAAPAVQELIPLLKDPQFGDQMKRKVFVRSATARILGKIGPQARPALPALRLALQDSAPYDRSIAAVAIWRIDSDATNTVPVLIEALNLVSDNSKWELLEGLEEMGLAAKEAFPALIDQMMSQDPEKSPSSYTLERITNALVQIDPEAAARAGVRLIATDQPRP